LGQVFLRLASVSLHRHHRQDAYTADLAFLDIVQGLSPLLLLVCNGTSDRSNISRRPCRAEAPCGRSANRAERSDRRTMEARVPLLTKFGYAVGVRQRAVRAASCRVSKQCYTLFSYQDMGARISANTTGAPLEEAL
jgi:hypothetical protein